MCFSNIAGPSIIAFTVTVIYAKLCFEVICVENELIESKAQMSFHLDGENEIDAALLSRMISDMAELTQLAAKEVNPDAYLKMNVTAFKNGSFQIDYSAVCQAAETIFTGAVACAGLAATVIGGVKGIFEIRKILKGEKPKAVTDKKDGYITVESQDGQIVRVPAQSGIAINVTQVGTLVANISSYSKEHNPDGGFSISDQDGEVYCSPKDIQAMSQHATTIETTTCQRSRVETDMLIRKAVFDGTAKWGFEFEGKAIDAAIEDEDFMKWFEGDGTVKKGDYIHAVLEILVETDSNGFPVRGTEKYTVVQVHGQILHGMKQIEFQ